MISQDLEDYQKAMQFFEKSTCYPVFEACRALGDIYHSGFQSSYSDNSYTVRQDHSLAFVHYAIGGIFGDFKAALAVGVYLEEGYHEDFGPDYNKALQWYEYTSKQFGSHVAELAVGKLKHKLASTLTDPSEVEELQKEAYKSFETVAISEPYAKFMMAVYHLNGWGGQEHDTCLGFEILLSLVESGLNEALLGIATCYARGVGVARDPVKALAFRNLATQLDEK
ncbi:hypothetical protein DFQ28_004909 [Apophysomyces sp. BC1034]|nr:hypothetical protein DFQ28_004909 [Apophysomyces sp. BC1034]